MYLIHYREITVGESYYEKYWNLPLSGSKNFPGQPLYVMRDTIVSRETIV